MNFYQDPLNSKPSAPFGRLPTGVENWRKPEAAGTNPYQSASGFSAMNNRYSPMQLGGLGGNPFGMGYSPFQNNMMGIRGMSGMGNSSMGYGGQPYSPLAGKSFLYGLMGMGGYNPFSMFGSYNPFSAMNGYNFKYGVGDKSISPNTSLISPFMWGGYPVL